MSKVENYHNRTGLGQECSWLIFEQTNEQKQQHNESASMLVPKINILNKQLKKRRRRKKKHEEH